MLFKTKFSRIFFAAIIVLFGFFIYFVSDLARAAKLDRYILYHVDDLFRYNYIKMALFDPSVFLNPYVKAGYALIYTAFLYILPIDIQSLRILSATLSLSTLFIIYKITQKLDFSEIGSIFAMLLVLTFPVYFLVSISTLAEMMFCFFLILAIYLLYCQRYLLSSAITALLPAIKQEGIIFLLVWLFILPRKFKVKYGLLLPLPFLAWTALNNVLLGHSFLYTLFCNLPDEAPPNSIASLHQLLRIIITLSIHPLFLFFLIGLAVNFRNEKYRHILACFVFYALALIIANIIHFIDAKAFSREIRFSMPLIPIMAIYGAQTIGRLLAKSTKGIRNAVIFLSMAMLPLVTMYQIWRLQDDPVIVADSLSGREEARIEEIGRLLSSYIMSEGISDVYIPGDIAIDKIIRRLWMYLPGNIKYYTLIGNMESYKTEYFQPLDMATYKIVPFKKYVKAVLVTKNQYDENKLAGINYNLLESEPALPIYIYVIQRKNS